MILIKINKVSNKTYKIKSRQEKMRRHINSKKISSVYFVCDMFQYKFNFG